MAYVAAVLAGLAFGAADQYLGSRSAALGVWAATTAQVSAPWLILPFLAGTTQERPRRAMVLGLVATASALVGYFAMTYSPMEGVPLERFVPGIVAIATSGFNPAYILGGLMTGPVFGLLGQRWRVRRSWVSAALVAGALCLEPTARWATGQLSSPASVWRVEVALGAVVGLLLGFAALASRRGSAARSSVPGDGSP
ncbi:MAG: DUF6518 family protein [Actinomycetota bacterium]